MELRKFLNDMSISFNDNEKVDGNIYCEAAITLVYPRWMFWKRNRTIIFQGKGELKPVFPIDAVLCIEDSIKV